MQNLSTERGAVIVTVALTLLFLLGFMGIALDFGRLFVVKTELQTAADSCALAAAQELDGGPDALTRAASAGMTAGNLNKVQFQGEAAGIIAADITFSDSLIGSYSATFAPVATAKYAKCVRTKTGIAPWLLQAFSGFTGDPSYNAGQSVFALGVATRASSMTTCMLPMGICSRPGGYEVGEWISGAVNASEAVSGQFRWLDYSGNPGGANDVRDLLQGEGQCNLPGADSIVRQSGNIGSAARAYNTRFGIYQGSNAPPADGIPDLTGYAWYLATDPPPGTLPNKYPLFVGKREMHAPYEGNNNPPDTKGLNTVGNTYSGSLALAGANRRIVIAPIVSCPIPSSSSTPVKVQSLACVLLLHPIRPGAGPGAKMWLEYRGAANEPGSPCSTLGLAGGDGGPLVPTLVQ